jgi:hypothetical protein
MTETIAEKVETPYKNAAEIFGAEAARGHELRRPAFDLFGVSDSTQLQVTRLINAIPEEVENEDLISGINKDRVIRGLPLIRFE